MTFALRSPRHLILRFAYRESHLLLSTNYYVQCTVKFTSPAKRKAQDKTHLELLLYNHLLSLLVACLYTYKVDTVRYLTEVNLLIEAVDILK